MLIRALLLALALGAAPPAAALDLFPRHDVTRAVRHPHGKPMANAARPRLPAPTTRGSRS